MTFLDRVFLFCVVCLVVPSRAPAFGELPPSPYDILQSHDLETPVLDAVPFCVPDGLDVAIDPILELATAMEWGEARTMLADWVEGVDQIGPELVVLDATFFGREGTKRKDLLVAEERFRTLLRRPSSVSLQLCERLELARILLLLSRESEAAAQLTRAEGLLDDLDQSGLHADEIKYWRAEILYRRHDPFDAHLAYRKIAGSESPRLALAARLRLTDLSFDAGKIDEVSVEYEALLPRASAFGASTSQWALRASEAAIDAGDYERGLRWIERFLESKPRRDARDAAAIRLADLDLAFDDPMRARKRLSKVTGRRRGDAIGAVASIRAIELGVSASSVDQRIDILLLAIREQRRGVRRYALGVLMGELSHRGDFDGALAVATRLAYEGVDPVTTPNFATELDDLLVRVTGRSLSEGGCQELVRALGGRYGILIERASVATPFARVGRCFEEMELPWLAATVYRTITRRFGALGAEVIALPLARSSLAIGELTLARRVATAALEDPTEDVEAWKAIVVEADFREGRIDEAVEGLREVLDSPSIAVERGKLVRFLALTLEERGKVEDARFIASRVPGWLSEAAPNSLAQANMIESVMLAAHAIRLAGYAKESYRLYRTVDEFAESSALRSSARFWLGLSREADSNGEPAWGDDPNTELGAPWGRFAIFEERFEPLSKAYSETLR